MYDVIIIGARCAGSPTAMLLANKGFKVLLVDKAQFPSDTISTHIIFPKGVHRLQKWGLFEKIINANTPIIHHMVLDLGDLVLKGTPPMPAGVPGMIAPRRNILDKILIDAAQQAGVDVREQCHAEEFIANGNHISALRIKEKNGHTYTERAKLVIGADGRNSLVAKSVGADVYQNKPPITFWYYTYWSGLPINDLVFYAAPNLAIGTIPTNNGLTCVPVACPANELKSFRTNIENNYMATIDMIPHLAEMIHKGTREEKFVGMTDVPNFFRKPFGPGWALVGDAGYHKDPITGQGISDAFRDAELISDTIEKVFDGEDSFDQAFANYQQTRDNESMAMYEFTCDWAKLEDPSPDMQQLFSALTNKQEHTNRFFGTLAGTVSIEDFYSPGNIQAILA